MTSAVTSPTSAVTGSTGSSGTTSSSASATGSGTALDADFTMFLKLLTTQLKNQDPLNPTDSSQFAVQLATFSGVEQQTKTNTLLTSIESQLGESSMSQLSGWIGMQVQSTAAAEFSGSPVSLAPKPESGADQTVLVVKDASGAQVASLSIPVSTTQYSWNGTDAAGTTLPAGAYTFQLQNYQNGKLIGTDDVPSYTKVVEAQTSSNGTVLVLDSGATVAAANVTALRAAH